MKVVRSPKKILTVLVCIGIALSQTACITAIATGNIAYLAGIILQSSEDATTQLIGIGLDEKNPGRSDFTNLMSKSTAKALNISDVERGIYNRDLPSVAEIDLKISHAIAKFVRNRRLDERDLKALADSTGQDTPQKLVEMFQGETISRLDLENFAKATDMNYSTAEIYLRGRWKVRISQ